MELFNFYNSIFEVFAIDGSVTMTDIWRAGGIAFGVWLVLFILQGIGLYVMAKRRNMKGRALAFVPFVNLYYIGRLIGDCTLFGRKVKRPGLYAMIAQILATLLMAAYAVVATILFALYGEYYQVSQYGGDWVNLPVEVEPLRRFYWICGGGVSGLSAIVVLIYQLLLLVLMIGLFRKYSPRNVMIFSILSCFIPVTRFILVFVLRNRVAIDYDAYVRKQREEFMRRQGGGYGPYGYGGPYRGPYNGPQNGPYGGGYSGGYQGENGYGVSQQPTPPPPEDPFAEFGSNSEKGKGSDDFFS